MRWKRNRAARAEHAADDIALAQQMRAEATEEHREAVRQGFVVAQLASRLIERRALNHFGDAIQITFTRRGHA